LLKLVEKAEIALSADYCYNILKRYEVNFDG